MSEANLVSLYEVLKLLAAQNPARPVHTLLPQLHLQSLFILLIISPASPIECAPVAQAVTTEWINLKPNLIEIKIDSRSYK